MTNASMADSSDAAPTRVQKLKFSMETSNSSHPPLFTEPQELHSLLAAGDAANCESSSAGKVARTTSDSLDLINGSNIRTQGS